MRFLMAGPYQPNPGVIPKVELPPDRQANRTGGTHNSLPDRPFLRDNAACDHRKRARTRKSMSRRSGQNGYIEKSGNWYVVRWRMDVEGQDERRYLREKICPISGPDKLSASERERKAKVIVERSGANSEQHFKRVVLGETTFREQAR